MAAPFGGWGASSVSSVFSVLKRTSEQSKIYFSLITLHFSLITPPFRGIEFEHEGGWPSVCTCIKQIDCAA